MAAGLHLTRQIQYELINKWILVRLLIFWTKNLQAHQIFVDKTRYHCSKSSTLSKGTHFRVIAPHEHGGQMSSLEKKKKLRKPRALRPASHKSSRKFGHCDGLMNGQTVFNPCILDPLGIIPQLPSYPLQTLSLSFKKINDYVLPKRLSNLCLDFLSNPLGYSARIENDEWMCWTTQGAGLICRDHLPM